MTESNLEELRSQLEFANKIRRNQVCTLNARLPISLIWGILIIPASYFAGLGGWYNLLLLPLLLIGGIGTMFTGLHLRRVKGELTEESEKWASLHWGASVLFIAGYIILTSLSSSIVSQSFILPLITASTYLFAGIHLEKSYLFAALFLFSGAVLLIFVPDCTPLEGAFITSVSLLLGALLAKVYYHGNR